MAELRHKVTGVTVSVSDETATRLPAEWASVGVASGNPDGTWKVADLRQYAEDHGIEIPEGAKKAEIVDAITGEE